MRKILFLLFMTLLLDSCKVKDKIVEVSIPQIKTEIKYIDKVKYDSIYLKDSVYIIQKGDTIYSTQVKYRYVYKNRIDTIIKVDTIPNIVTITNTEVQNKLYNWQKILIVIGLITTLLLISYIVKYLKDNIKF